MLDDPAVVGQAENVDAGVILVAGPVLEAMQDDVVSLGEDAFELDALAGVLARHAPEVVDEALTHGPQVITKRGVEAVIVLSYAEYRTMLLQQKKLSAFFRESPLVDADLDLTRDASPPRAPIDL